MYRLAIYGKGGIGKSTTASNVAAALAQRGHTVMQVGCDPKADSTCLHLGGAVPPTVLDRMREGGSPVLGDIVRRAPDGVYCVEAGGPVPGIGCAGRGIIAAFEQLERLHAFEECRPDVVLYDVLGDVVCGGFAMPLRGDYSDAVMVVTSGEMMSLYAAGNIMRAVAGFQARGYARFRGLIANLRNIQDEQGRIARFCEEEQARVVASIPRSPLVQQAEDAGATVVSLFPESDAAQAYGAVADVIEREAAACAGRRAAGGAAHAAAGSAQLRAHGGAGCAAPDGTA